MSTTNACFISQFGTISIVMFLLFLKFTMALYVFMLLSRGKGEVERSIIETPIYTHKEGEKQYSSNGRQGNKINFHLCLLSCDWQDVY